MVGVLFLDEKNSIFFKFESFEKPYYTHRSMIHGLLTFVKAAFKNPMQVSTVFPSSGFLSNDMLDQVDIENCKSIVEIGVGTGAITKHIARRIPKGCKYVGVEVSDEMTQYMNCL